MHTHNRAKLTWAAVGEIRRLYHDEHIIYRKLGEQFGVSLRCIAKICAHESWPDINYKVTPPKDSPAVRVLRRKAENGNY